MPTIAMSLNPYAFNKLDAVVRTEELVEVGTRLGRMSKSAGNLS
jgi:hypothetical protein